MYCRDHRGHRGAISSFAPFLPRLVHQHTFWSAGVCGGLSSVSLPKKSFLYEHRVLLCHGEAYPLWLSACSIVKVENWVWCVVWKSKQLWWKCLLYSLFCVPSPLTLANSANCQQSANSWRLALTHGLLPFRKTLAAVDTALSLLLVIFEEEITRTCGRGCSLGFLALKGCQMLIS